MYATHLSRTRDFRLWSLSDERQNACNTLSVPNVRANRGEGVKPTEPLPSLPTLALVRKHCNQAEN